MPPFAISEKHFDSKLAIIIATLGEFKDKIDGR